MSLESNIADLNTATAELLTAINTQKSVLDTTVASTAASAVSAENAVKAAAQKLKSLPVSTSDYATLDALFASTGERVTRRVLQFGSALKPISNTLVIDNAGIYADVGLLVRGSGFNLQDASQSSGINGAGLNAPLIKFNRTNAENNDAETLLEDFALVGATAPSTSVGQQDGISGSSTDLTTNRLLIQYMNRHGVNLDLSFSSKLESGLVFGCFGSGVRFTNAANRVALRDVRAFTNGRDFGIQDQANIFMFGNGNTGYGAVIENCDVSYSGYTKWSYAKGNLTSVVVSNGVANVTTVTAHGLVNGNFIGIKLSGVAAMDSRAAKTITSTGANTFTFTTAAPNGSYMAEDLVIGPHSNGIEAVGMDGLRVNGFYCEVPMGYAGYFGNCKALTVEGGFVLSGTLFLDVGCIGAEIGGIKFQGMGGLETNEVNQRSTINVKSSNVFEDGAAWTHGVFYMQDGIRYGNSIPVNGSWLLGEVLLNSSAGVGDPTGWKCVQAGTPGVFAPLGVTGHKFMPQQRNSSAMTVTDVVTDLNQLLAKLKSANLMST